jgi:ferric-dicitrate binding protein FerR (iron transport regulator)
MNGVGDDFRDLCDAAIEGRLTPDEAARLERLVVNDPESRRIYVEYVQQHASLHWSAADPASLAPPGPAKPALSHRARSRRWVGAGIAAAAALLACAWLAARSSPTPALHVATLAGGKACKWDSGSLPTADGARLPAGRLRLAEGLARLTFANGAEVTLEAPAELELVSPRRCVLHAGRLVAKVPAEAIGFTIDTPTAVIEDLGTEFGVNVGRGRAADVQVFDGRVDVLHRKSGKVEHMDTGENFRFALEDFARFDPLAERPAAVRPGPGAGGASERLIQVSTATGRGKDAYIRPPFPMRDGPEALLLVKNSTQDQYSRKAYLGFDLAPAGGLKVVSAQLSLAFAPTGLGYASEVPDATFGVFGLADESLDAWDESSICWENAPANRPGGAGLDPEKVVFLGRFEIVQGLLTGIREVSGAPLVDFLNRDTNGTATLILVRETKGSGRSDLVHGFAGKHHPVLPPPTLKLTLVTRPR